MTYSVTQGTLESLAAVWDTVLPASATDSIFLTPRWQRLWWKHFGEGAQALVYALQCEGQTVGVAPMYLRDDELSLMGGTEVCDYGDFVLPAEHCTGGLSALFAHLEPLPWSTLVLHSVPAESPTLGFLRNLDARYAVAIEQEDVAPGLDLDSDWETYLGTRLNKKDRHELRRKFRRLDAAGDVRFVTCTDHGALPGDISDFLKLHRESRDDKAAFMTDHMEAFFRETVTEFLAEGTARLSFLEVNGNRAAAILAFDYRNDRLLYNSGFDQAFSYLSVGLLLKALSLREAIESGKRRYDFLRGNEPYKYDLGAVDRAIYQCTVRRVD